MQAAEKRVQVKMSVLPARNDHRQTVAFSNRVQCQRSMQCTSKCSEQAGANDYLHIAHFIGRADEKARENARFYLWCDEKHHKTHWFMLIMTHELTYDLLHCIDCVHAI